MSPISDSLEGGVRRKMPDLDVDQTDGTRPSTAAKVSNDVSETDTKPAGATKVGHANGDEFSDGVTSSLKGGHTDAATVLFASLQRVGVAGIKEAAGNVLQALKNAPLSPTSPEVESAAKQLVSAALDGKLDGKAIEQGIAGLELDQPEVALGLAQAVGARLEAMQNKIPGGQPAIDDALDAVSRVVLSNMNHGVATLLAGRDLSPAGQLSPYSVRADQGADMYSNEPGLNKMLAGMGERPGAVVGVGGAVLDAASRLKSTTIVSVDQDPRIAQGIEVLVGVMAAVDTKLGVDADKDARLQAVTQRLDGTVPLDDVKAELLEQGISPTTLANAQSILASLSPKARTSVGRNLSDDVWSLSDDAADRVDHLSKLGREGRIFAFSGDLSQPATAAHVTRLLEARGDQVGYFQLSNVLDWVSDAASLVDNLGHLPFRDDAVMATTTMLADDTQAFRDELIEDMGSHLEPVARPVDDWLGDQGLGQKMHDKFWGTTERRQHYHNVMSYFLTGSFNKVDDGSLDALQKFVDGALDKSVDDNKFVSLLDNVVSNSGLKPIVFELLGAGGNQTDVRQFVDGTDVAKTRRNIPQALDAYLRSALTPEGKEGFLRKQTEGLDVDDGQLKSLAAAAESLIELERALASLRQSA